MWPQLTFTESQRKGFLNNSKKKKKCEKLKAFEACLDLHYFAQVLKCHNSPMYEKINPPHPNNHEADETFSRGLVIETSECCGYFLRIYQIKSIVNFSDYARGIIITLPREHKHSHSAAQSHWTGGVGVIKRCIFKMVKIDR